MKKTLLLALAIIASAVTTVSSAQGTYSETRNVTGFDEVAFAVAGEVYISFGQEYKVVLEGDKDYLAKIETKLSGGTLEIKNEKWFNTSNEKVIAHITMPLLKGLELSGSGKVFINDLLKTQSLEVGISGSGKIYAKEVEINKLECDISGSGSIEISGSGTITDGELSVSGSGNLAAPATKIAHFEVNISGSGKCDCYVTEKLEGSISGSGNITYSGNPKIDASISGSGHIRAK
jgi:hypothetical protein